MTSMSRRRDSEGAQTNRWSTRQKAKRHRLVAQTRAPEARFRKDRLRQSNPRSRRLLSRHAPSEGSLHHCLLLGSAATPPIARLAMSERPKVSSVRLWRTFQVQSPSRVDKTRLDLMSRQAVEPPIPACTHLLRKSGQKQGFITRMKTEPIDQIAGDRCDFFSRRIKEWQSHRGARCNSRFVKARRRSAPALGLVHARSFIANRPS